MTDYVTTALYYWYDAHHVLLYIGITDDLTSRQTDHAKRSTWSIFADHAKVEHLPSRKRAETAERKAIETKKPVFNRTYNDAPGARQRLVDYLTEKNRLDLLRNYRYGPIELAARTPGERPTFEEPVEYQRVIRLGGRLVVASVSPGRYLCTGRNRKGMRCKLGLEIRLIAASVSSSVPSVGEVHAYDLLVDGNVDQWVAQRCEHHWPDGVAFAEPEWEDFDPGRHMALLDAPALANA
jgi:predicted GIY-YIG superfamily endonuclease